MTISPNYASDLEVYFGEDGGGVYRVIDRPANPEVTQMNAGFPDLIDGGSVTALAFAPGNPHILFAGVWGGADGGVWQFLFPYKTYLPAARK